MSAMAVQSNYQGLIDNDDGPGIQRSFQFRISPSGQLEFIRFNTGDVAFTAASGTIPSSALSGLFVAIGRTAADGTVTCYASGATPGSATITGTPQSSITGTVQLGGIKFNTSSYYPLGTRLFSGAWNYAFSDGQVKKLLDNPWQLFAPIPRRIWVPSAGTGNATATLTGASTTSSAGTLSATGGASKTLPGASTTASAGTVSASASTNASTTLTGAATTASAGTLAATGGAAVTLTGAGTTASAGTVSATAGGNATGTLPSASTTSSAGTLSATGGASKTLTGASTTASAGAVLASAGTNASVTLTGAATSAAVGALSASGAAQIVLPGVQVTASAGTVTATGVRNASVTLTGTAATAYAGAVSAYAGIMNVFTRPPKSATLHGKSRQVAVLLSRPDRDIGNILKD